MMHQIAAPMLLGSLQGMASARRTKNCTAGKTVRNQPRYTWRSGWLSMLLSSFAGFLCLHAVVFLLGCGVQVRQVQIFSGREGSLSAVYGHFCRLFVLRGAIDWSAGWAWVEPKPQRRCGSMNHPEQLVLTPSPWLSILYVQSCAGPARRIESPF